MTPARQLPKWKSHAEHAGRLESHSAGLLQPKAGIRVLFMSGICDLHFWVDLGMKWYHQHAFASKCLCIHDAGMYKASLGLERGVRATGLLSE